MCCVSSLSGSCVQSVTGPIMPIQHLAPNSNRARAATACDFFLLGIFDHLLCVLPSDKRVSSINICISLFMLFMFQVKMLKFLCICLIVALGVVLSIPMDMTTLRPEATTEDTSGRLLTLPDPVKCENSKLHLLIQCQILSAVSADLQLRALMLTMQFPVQRCSS